MLEFHTHQSMRDIAQSDWDNLLGEEGAPYLRWDFLEALEATGCVRPEVGWGSAHFSLWRDGQLEAVAPAYIKGNSDGEFVFDHSWAQFAHQRLDCDYYPKVVVACPFTPATGARLLMRRGVDEEILVSGMVAGIRRFTETVGLSSAHILFPREREARLCAGAGLALRYGIQFHWRNRGYESFEDFLACYNSKRRNQIRRERRALKDQGIELEVVTGSDLSPEKIDHAYEFYRATVDKYYWGRHYLNRDFFQEVCSRLPDNVLIVLAREGSGGRYVAGAFNLMGGGRLFGRYWGASEELRYLHFNVCYYQGIEECIVRGLEVFEPGAGGEHKIVRGFEPTITYSVHHLHHPRLNEAVREFLNRERGAIEAEVAGEPRLLKEQPK